ncbi:MAG: SagB/ThcOx family dehydrogenase [Methylotetracoccus sp.]
MNDSMQVTEPAPPADTLRRAYDYHQRTKHHFNRYAAGPGHMDWATQPDPFRRFTGTAEIPLPLAGDLPSPRYADLFRRGTVPARPNTLADLALVLELSFGLSAWKGYGGDRWALRCNPSSGNLHPTEAYVVVGRGLAGLDSGVYHYCSHEHSLERRCRAELPFDAALIGLTSIHWREAWKYGERAFRYCQHDVGHALGALRYATATAGWTVRLLEEWGDADIARLLGLDRDGDFDGAEREAPDLLCAIGSAAASAFDIDRLTTAAAQGLWAGKANTLSRRHLHDWPAIDEVHHATVKPRTEAISSGALSAETLEPPNSEFTAAELIRQRRSAQAFDGSTAIPARALWRILDPTLPHTSIPPFDVWPWPPRIHLLLFVHRVVGLPSGLYLLPRDEQSVAGLRAALRPDLGWEPVAEAPRSVPLVRLVRADCRNAARVLSCHQDIASDGAFSLGMLAEFDATLNAAGTWAYRRLFWECGLIGQALYLEAEAAGVRGTGIGCFFDDAVHELLGIADTRFQSLYHFTVGAALDDARLQTLPPYGHLAR